MIEYIAKLKQPWKVTNVTPIKNTCMYKRKRQFYQKKKINDYTFWWHTFVQIKC